MQQLQGDLLRGVALAFMRFLRAKPGWQGSSPEDWVRFWDPRQARGIAKELHKLLHLFKNTVTPMTDSASRFGFVAFAETLNGRLAMLGFLIGLGTELLTGQGILSQIGLG